MAGGLQEVDGGGGTARCSHCGKVAAGPCARCRKPTCGDCCVLTEGGVGVFAICLACDAKGGRTLGSGWRTIVLWIVATCIALVGINILLRLLFS